MLAEREEERKRLINSLWEIDRLAAERDTLAGQVRQLNYAVDHALNCVADRDRMVAEREELITQLRAGLAHAETLAFARAGELQRIRSFFLLRGFERLLRLLRPPSSPSS